MRSALRFVKKGYSWSGWVKQQPPEVKRHLALIGTSFLLHFTKLTRLKRQMKRQAPVREFIAIGLIEHFGDIVACEPVSRYVRQKYPQAYIVWCARKPYQELIDNNPYVDQALAIHCLTEWMFLAKSGLFDEVIDLHIQDRYCLVCRIPLKKTKGNTAINWGNYYDFGSLLSSFSQSAGIPDLHEQPKIYIPRPAVDKVDAYHLPDRFVVIHCSANDTRRDWQTSKWQALVEKMIKDWRLHVIEVGLASAMDNLTSPNYINFCGKLSILETAEVIRRSQLFIGIDSGPAHLANATDTFGIILLGYFGNYKRYMPYSGNYTKSEKAELIYQEGPAAEISIERVYQAVARYFSDQERANAMTSVHES